MSGLEQFYSQRIEAFSIEIALKKKELLFINLGRLFTFLSFLITPFILYPENHGLGIAIPFISLVIFLFLVKLNGMVDTKKKYLENLVSISKNEIEALHHNFSCFDPGIEFINPDHFNSYDLDLFGKGSLFQFINRTVTINGKSILAEMLTVPLLDAVSLKKRQELVAELIPEVEWRQDFAASGMMYMEGKDESDMFNRWGKEKFNLRSINALPFLLIALPLLSLSSLAYWIIFKNSALFIFSVLIEMIYWLIERENITRIYNQFGKRVEILSKYASLITKIENRKWFSVEGKEKVNEVETMGIPSKEISNLKNIISAFDNRRNILVGFILNGMFVWDILCSYQLIKWHEKNLVNYKRWDALIAFFDAVCSLSNMAYNHPDFVFPSFASGKFHFEAEHLGHPLIRPEKRITNHFKLGKEKQIVVVTGANMAGKSTFLRTVGVNMVLGMTGAPVCASKIEFVPVEVFSNMRTTDSLFDEESYFFAELKRIKAILSAVESGRSVLIILDEILKGTNSVDKLSGSQKLVKRFIGLNVPVILATHDLKLTEMKTEYPDHIQNNCFEITIADNEMFFDYTLRNGVTQTMNATFLMIKMGII
jgi:DNA mismatch repair ATPase MutS